MATRCIIACTLRSNTLKGPSSVAPFLRTHTRRPRERFCLALAVQRSTAGRRCCRKASSGSPHLPKSPRPENDQRMCLRLRRIGEARTLWRLVDTRFGARDTWTASTRNSSGFCARSACVLNIASSHISTKPVGAENTAGALRPASSTALIKQLCANIGFATQAAAPSRSCSATTPSL